MPYGPTLRAGARDGNVAYMRTVDKMPQQAGRAGRPYRYDWTKLFDGQARVLDTLDFAGTARDFSRQVRRAARTRFPHLDVKVVSRSNPERVYVQASPRAGTPQA
jgi:hypothetical protein